MDYMNRAIVILVALFLLAASVITILVALDALAADFLPGTAEESWFQPQLQGLAGFEGWQLAVSVIAAAAVGLLMLILLAMELKPNSSNRFFTVSASREGNLTVDETSVRELAESTALNNQAVDVVRCRIRTQGKRTASPTSIIVDCYPVVVAGSNVQEVRDDLQARIKETVERLTGLRVSQVNVARIRYESGQNLRLMGA